MHNTHFICVEAESGKDALGTAESELTGWGNENNWRSFLMAISERGRVVEGDKGDDTYSSLKVINESVREEFDSVCIDGYLKELDMLHAKLKTEGRLNSMEWWSAKKIAEHMEAVMDVAVQTHGKPFDVFRHEYRPGCYDDFGVTHFYDAGSVAKARKSGDKIKLWCVVMDMHS